MTTAENPLEAAVAETRPKAAKFGALGSTIRATKPA
jgi:hypothetical protein